MTVNKEETLELAKRKNATKRVLLEKRSRAYMPSGTDQMKKVVMDADCAKEQEAYDNLCDEYNINFELIKLGDSNV